MKPLKSIIGGCLAIAASALIAAPPSPGVPWNVVWRDTNNIPALSQYVPNTNNCYILLGTNVLGAPVASWPVIAVLTSWTLGTNGADIWYTNTVTLTPPAPGQSFYVSIIASNAWGAAGSPSSVAPTVPVSTPPASLILSR